MCFIDYLDVVLNDADLPYVTPNFLYITIGEKAQFYCSATRGVLWTYYGDPELPRNAHTEGFNDEILIIDNAQRWNSGTYSCNTLDDKDNKAIANAELVVVGKIGII